MNRPEQITRPAVFGTFERSKVQMNSVEHYLSIFWVFTMHENFPIEINIDSENHNRTANSVINKLKPCEKFMNTHNIK
jgi:hypothetical protein